MTALWRYKDTEAVVKAMDGYTPGEGWVLYVPAQPATAWHDAPTVPGLWLDEGLQDCPNRFTASDIQQFQVDTGTRWYGPIPEDMK